MLPALLFLLPLFPLSHCKDGWETLLVAPQVSGLRVENIGEEGFQGYNEAWSLLVLPDVEVTVVIFGFWLDKVEYVTFTDQICQTSEFNVSNSRFTIQNEFSIAFRQKFPAWESPWRMCIKQKGQSGELLLIDDDRTWISTELKAKEHYLPLPLQISILVVFFAMSALFSGLNLGLMSLSTQELQLIINSGTERDAAYAKAILPIRKRGNYLLCTILIMNVVVNVAISILFEDLTSGATAFITSSLGIVVLGEIVPQSACVKHGLAVGARTLFLTRFFMIITWPLAYPISKLLDLLLGEDVDQFDRNRLVEIMKMTTEDENKDLAADLKIAVGAMEFAKKSAGDIMTRIDDVYMLSEDDVLDATTIADIVKRGYTRIPVYKNNDRNQVTSLLFVKDLALVDKKHLIPAKTVSQYHDRELRIVDENTPLSELLEEFKQGNYHLALVKRGRNLDSIRLKFGARSLMAASFMKNPSAEQELIGLVTLEDIIEEILQSEIVDESDSVLDNVQRSKRKASQTKIAELFCCESRSKPLSITMLEVVCNYLRDKSQLFTNTFMEDRTREHLVQKNIRQAILVSRRVDGTNRSVKLFEADQPSKRMILILEGTARADFETGMSFEVGPWSFFGEALLSQIVEALKGDEDIFSSISFTPDFDLVVEQPCRFLQITVSSLVHALRMSELVKSFRTPSIVISDTGNDEDHVPLLMSRGGRKSPLLRVRHASTIDSSTVDGVRVRSSSTVSATRDLHRLKPLKYADM